MKGRITISIALSLLLSVATFAPTAKGQQPPGKFSKRSGVITLGPGQGLRVTVVNTEEKDIRVRLAWAQYIPAGCSGMPAVCRHTVASQGVTAPETLGADQALSFDVPPTGGGVNVTVSANSPNARVLGVVFDTSTQRIIAICTFIPD